MSVHYTATWKVTALLAAWCAFELLSSLIDKGGRGWIFWTVMALVFAWFARNERRDLQRYQDSKAGEDRACCPVEKTRP